MKLFHGIIQENIAILTEEESHHAQKVLRLNIDDSVEVTNGFGQMIRGKIQKLGKKMEIFIEEYLPQNYIPKQNLHIAIAPTKNIDRIEFFIEKATELGVTEISFVISKNSERKIINEDKIKKQLISASKQSLRSMFPVFNSLIKLDDFLKKHDSKSIFVAHCDAHFERENLDKIQLQNPIILIGPEGDFSKEEIQKMIDLQIKSVTLGNQRLRTETAGIFVASYFYAK